MKLNNKEILIEESITIIDSYFDISNKNKAIMGNHCEYFKNMTEDEIISDCYLNYIGQCVSTYVSSGNSLASIDFNILNLIVASDVKSVEEYNAIAFISLLLKYYNTLTANSIPEQVSDKLLYFLRYLNERSCLRDYTEEQHKAYSIIYKMLTLSIGDREESIIKELISSDLILHFPEDITTNSLLRIFKESVNVESIVDVFNSKIKTFTENKINDRYLRIKDTLIPMILINNNISYDTKKVIMNNNFKYSHRSFESVFRTSLLPEIRSFDLLADILNILIYEDDKIVRKSQKIKDIIYSLIIDGDITKFNTYDELSKCKNGTSKLFTSNNTMLIKSILVDGCLKDKLSNDSFNYSTELKIYDNEIILLLLKCLATKNHYTVKESIEMTFSLAAFTSLQIDDIYTAIKDITDMNNPTGIAREALREAFFFKNKMILKLLYASLYTEDISNFITTKNISIGATCGLLLNSIENILDESEAIIGIVTLLLINSIETSYSIFDRVVYLNSLFSTINDFTLINIIERKTNILNENLHNLLDIDNDQHISKLYRSNVYKYINMMISIDFSTEDGRSRFYISTSGISAIFNSVLELKDSCDLEELFISELLPSSYDLFNTSIEKFNYLLDYDKTSDNVCNRNNLKILFKSFKKMYEDVDFMNNVLMNYFSYTKFQVDSSLIAVEKILSLLFSIDYDNLCSKFNLENKKCQDLEKQIYDKVELYQMMAINQEL